MSVDTEALRRISNDIPGSVTSNLQKASADEIDNLRAENAELHTALSACVRFLDGDYLMQIKVWARENGASIRTTPLDMDVNYMRGLIERTRPQ